MLQRIYQTATILNFNLKNRNIYFSVPTTSLNYLFLRLVVKEKIVQNFKNDKIQKITYIRLNSFAINYGVTFKPASQLVSLSDIKLGRNLKNQRGLINTHKGIIPLHEAKRRGLGGRIILFY